ncbi:MAG: hypothetical protein V4813_14510 [Gemmatimonadota bacterium]
MLLRISRVFVATSVAALAACGGSKSPTGGSTPTASIGITSGAPTLSVEQGASGSANLTVSRTNFSGNVTLTAEGVPTGVTATFTPATVASGATTSSLGLAIGAAAAPGTSTITVRARGTGVLDATTTIALTVTTPVSGTVGLTLTPAASTITAGQIATSTVAITRGGGFAGGVNLTVTGAPSGITTSFATANPVTANSVTMSLSTVTSVVPGPYTLTVKANAAGLTEATATYVLTVNAPPSNSISYRYCNARRIPLWFAYLDGTTGTWQRVTPTSTGVYDFAVGQPTVGIAAVYNDLGEIVTDVTYYSLAEVATAAAAECIENPVAGTKSLSGTVTGFTSGSESANVAIGNAVSTVASQGNPAFFLQQVQSGARDLIAVRSNVTANTTERVLLVRATNFADNGTTGPLDLGGSTSFAPGSATVKITAPNDGTLVGSTIFSTANGSGAQLTIGTLSSDVTANYQAIPDANMLASDLQRVTVQQAVGMSINRSISRYIRGPVAIVMAMPVDPGAPTVTAIAGAAYPRATATGTVPAAFNRSVLVQWENTAASRRWVITSTADARASSLNYSLTMPDFSAVPGWTATWQMPGGSADVTSRFSGQTGAGTSGEPINGTTTFSLGRRTAFAF